MLSITSANRKKINLSLKFFHYKDQNDILISKGSRIICDINIGRGTRINGAFLAKGSGTVSIGKYCAVGWNVKCMTTNHDVNYANVQYFLQKKLGVKIPVASKKDISIGNNVWIGDSVILLPGVNVGDCAVIGSGSVVTKDIPSFCVFAGNPARFIKKRFTEEKIQMLLSLKWWEWPLERIKENVQFFETNISDTGADEILKIIK